MDDGQHGVQQQEIQDAYQAYHSHATYLDPAQGQAIASYMPDFATMNSDSREAGIEQFAQGMPTEGVVQNDIGQQVHHSETESDLEEGVDAGRVFEETFHLTKCPIFNQPPQTIILQLNIASQSLQWTPRPPRAMKLGLQRKNTNSCA